MEVQLSRVHLGGNWVVVEVELGGFLAEWTAEMGRGLEMGRRRESEGVVGFEEGGERRWVLLLVRSELEDRAMFLFSSQLVF